MVVSPRLTRSRDRRNQPKISTVPPTKQLCSKYAQALFRHGQKVAESKGLILVDTKYEFGKVSHSDGPPMQGILFWCGNGWKGITQIKPRVAHRLVELMLAHPPMTPTRTRTGRSSSSTRCTRPTLPATGSRRPTTRASRRCVRGLASAVCVGGGGTRNATNLSRNVHDFFSNRPRPFQRDRAWSQRTSTRSSSASGSR